MCLLLQFDGNLVLYANGVAVWSTRTDRWLENTNTLVKEFVMQEDGNMVLYDETGRIMWQSYTAGKIGAKLTVKNNACMTLDKDDIVFWGFWHSGLWVPHAKNLDVGKGND